MKAQAQEQVSLSSKEQEIKMIESLIAFDGYFSDEFSNCQEMIKANIMNDFPFLCGTKWDIEKNRMEQVKAENESLRKAYENQKNEISELNRLIKELKEERLMAAEKMMVLEPNSNEINELAETLVGRDFAAALRVRDELPLLESNREFIVNFLMK